MVAVGVWVQGEAGEAGVLPTPAHGEGTEGPRPPAVAGLWCEAACRSAARHRRISRPSARRRSTTARATKDQGPAQGDAPMSGPRPGRHIGLMARYLLYHRHEPDECGVVFASFKGHQSPLRHRPALASCRTGGHAIWWAAEGGSEEDALRRLGGRGGFTARPAQSSRSSRGLPVACFWQQQPWASSAVGFSCGRSAARTSWWRSHPASPSDWRPRVPPSKLPADRAPRGAAHPGAP